MTQKERVLALLRGHEVLCGQTLYERFMPNGRNRIAELRQRGFQIRSTPCEHRLRGDPPFADYRLIAGP